MVAAHSYSSNDPIIVFDGVCNLCDHFVQFLIRYDRIYKYRFTSNQSEIGMRILEDIGKGALGSETVILIENNQVFVRSSAVIRIISGLGGPWRIVQLALLIPTFFRDEMYSFVSKRRYKWFGKRDSCIRPAPDYMSRFL